MRKKPPRDNKGFTLVELIVAVALLAVITPILAGLITTGAGFYRSISAELALQRDTQIVMAQVREYVIDCTAIQENTTSDGDSGVLTVEQTQSPDESKEYTFSFDADKKILSLAVGDITAELATGVRKFSVTRFSESDADANPSAVTVELELEKMGKTRAATQVIYMRNHPV
jgi:prepilin-type N-terminal cleavage/methylation domain-containing protein